MRNKQIKFISFFLSLLFFASIISAFSASAAEQAVGGDSPLPEAKDLSSLYDAYQLENQSVPFAQNEIKLTVDQISEQTEAVVKDASEYESDGKVVLTNEKSSVTWTFTVDVKAKYNIQIIYYALAGSSSGIERELLIDGKYPFSECQSLTLQRSWKSDPETLEKDGSFQTDSRGNHVVPSQVPVERWESQFLFDISGFIQGNYEFSFEPGVHTLTIGSLRESVAIKEIILKQTPKQVSYAEYEKSLSGKPDYTDDFQKIQAEHVDLKSEPVLFPISDRSSVATEPSDPTKIRLNTIGGANWSVPGQWLEWDVTPEQSGVYSLALKVRQNLVSGMFSTRRLYINGEVPFAEANQIEVQYDGKWQMIVLGGQNDPYRFYFEAGKAYRIKMEVVIGRSSGFFTMAQNSLLQLNDAYRKIIMLTSTVPDPLRNYHIPTVMPEVMTIFKEQAVAIRNIAKELESITVEKGANNTILDNLIYQLESFEKKPLTITQRLESFRSNISALGSWVLSLSKQPLEIDYIGLVSPQKTAPKQLPKIDAGFFDGILYETKAFLGSFVEDYSVIGDEQHKDKSIDVWINTGRDQASVLKRLIVTQFTKKTGINVNLKITGVGGGISTLLLATVAGMGPDIAMSIGNAEPINYAARSAAKDISGMEGFEETVKRFMPSAMVPFEYDGGFYALPETQTFMMTFYRKDVMQEMNLEVPKTWEDVYTLIGDLQKKHMTVGLPGAGGTMTLLGTMLAQQGLSIYNEQKTRCMLDEPQALATFNNILNLYKNYQIPLDYDAANRFRMGEMPLIVTDYTMFNVMNVFAPELKGLWDFAPIPGMLKKDGTIDNTSTTSGVAVMMLSTTTKEDMAWEYMKWWTDTPTQISYGRELESLLGIASRHPSANIEALKQLSWRAKDLEKIISQWEKTKAIPEVPGGYYTPRYIDNALRTSLNYDRDPRELLKEYTQTVNEEIAYKLKQFGLV